MAITVLLVVPPQRGLLEGFASGLVSIANYLALQAPDLRVRLLDYSRLELNLLENRAADAIREADGPIFVGITGTTADYQSMLATARAFRKKHPSCKIVLGGHHVSSQDEVVLRRHRGVVDYVIRGEGEIALLALIRANDTLEAVPNLSYRVRGEIRRNPEARLLQEAELDVISPTYSGRGEFTAGKFNHITYVSARGCPLTCAFCVVRATAIRAKSIDGVIDDLRRLVAKGSSRIAIEDNFFAHQPRRTLELCARIKELQREVPFEWDCQTRVESMRRSDVIQAMAEAGCTAAYLGVEALCERHLRYLAKTPDPVRYVTMLVEEVAPLMLASGIGLYLNLQLGIPDETDEDWMETLRVLRRIADVARRASSKITLFPQLNVIYPGTPHFEMAVDKGVFGANGAEIFESFTKWEAREEPILHFLGEHFAHGVGGIPLGLMDRASLARGKFAVDSDQILRLVNKLHQIEATDGVIVFRYGRYLSGQEAVAHA